MTNYDMTMDMLAASTFHPDSVEQARKYLRDLKVSHDRLMMACEELNKQLTGAFINDDMPKTRSAATLTSLSVADAALKAAEVLR